MTATHLRHGIERISRQLDALKSFDPTSVMDRSNAPQLTSLRAGIEDAVSRTFGYGTHEYTRYSRAAHFNSGPISLGGGFGRGGGGPPIGQIHRYLTQSKEHNVALLEQAIESLRERQRELGDTEEPGQVTAVEPTELSKRVFIVHGHDREAKEAVARALQTLGLEPIILNEQPNMGRTVIEKFEAEGDVGFAVVILTADDLGKAKDEDQVSPRARQNVILELGYFVGTLGRRRVCALVRGNLELPSDFAGVVYEKFDDGGAWKLLLGRELRAAGYTIDMNQL